MLKLFFKKIVSLLVSIRTDRFDLLDDSLFLRSEIGYSLYAFPLFNLTNEDTTKY